MVLRIIHICVCVLNSQFRSQNIRMRMHLFLLLARKQKSRHVMDASCCFGHLWGTKFYTPPPLRNPSRGEGCVKEGGAYKIPAAGGLRHVHPPPPPP